MNSAKGVAKTIWLAYQASEVARCALARYALYTDTPEWAAVVAADCIEAASTRLGEALLAMGKGKPPLCSGEL